MKALDPARGEIQDLSGWFPPGVQIDDILFDGPVWDDDGGRYDKCADGLWRPACDPQSEGMTMSELVDYIGPDNIRYENSDFPRPGELSYVSLRDRSKYVAVPLKGDPLTLLVVLPTNDAGKTIHADDVQYCTPLVAVPQSDIGSSSPDALDWVCLNRELQPTASDELGACNIDGYEYY